MEATTCGKLRPYLPTVQLAYRDGSCSSDISKDNENYTAHLTLPEGSGPFPVVVLSHGRGGAKGSYYNWGRQMTEWGFAAIAMDHYTPVVMVSACPMA